MHARPAIRLSLAIGFAFALALASASLAQEGAPQPTATSVRDNFAAVNRKILAMARDFPQDKYSYRLKPEMRSFAEVIVHVASGIVYAGKVGRGEKASWDEIDPKAFATKASVVALLEKAVADSQAALKALPDASFAKTIEPWDDVTEHSAEHYGLLVAYYRANGIVPPESRPQK